MAKKKKQEVVPVPNLYGESIKFATESFREGKSEKYIVECLLEANKNFTPENLQFIINRASKEIADQHVRDRPSIVALHIKRYDVEIKKAYEEHHLDIELPHIRRQMRIQSLELVLNAMFAKERVLQIHAKETQVKIFNRLNAKIKERKISYDLSTLTLAEKIDFLSLVTKAKRNENEVFSVITKPKETIITEDIEHEEVENNNIALIEKTNIPVPEEEPLPEVKITDVIGKLKGALAKVAEKEFKKKGATTDRGPAVIDIRKQALKK